MSRSSWFLKLEIPASSVRSAGRSVRIRQARPLLFLLAGLEEGLEGSVAWGEHDVAKMGASGRRFETQTSGAGFSDFQLMPGMSALENVLLPQTFERWSVPFSMRERAMIPDAGDGTGTEDAGGCVEAVAWRNAARRDSPHCSTSRTCLLADEPTASLDAENEESVARLLLRPAKEDGCT
jgi:putative ABC transport system ATP-binding protein